MNDTFRIAKCESCGALVKVINDCTCDDCGIKCCGEKMQILIPNSTDASVEKHVPVYTKVEDEIFVTVNHPMDKEHFIEWVVLVKENTEYIIKMYPEQNAECRFKYIPGSTIYAYCNKHGLWKKDVE